MTGDRVVVDGSLHPETGHLALVTWHRLLQLAAQQGGKGGSAVATMRVAPLVPLLQVCIREGAGWHGSVE